MTVNSVIAKAKSTIITKFIVSRRFLIAGGIALSLSAVLRDFLDFILLVKFVNSYMFLSSSSNFLNLSSSNSIIFFSSST